MIPSPSRSHCTAAPATNALPSSANATSSPTFQATVVSSPKRLGMGFDPTLTRTKAPVPYVHFASPTPKHACPKSAAC